MAQKLSEIIKIPIVLYRSYMVMPNKYPVNLDALILLFQGNTSRFIE